jgi:hypothetical protein
MLKATFTQLPTIQRDGFSGTHVIAGQHFETQLDWPDLLATEDPVMGHGVGCPYIWERESSEPVVESKQEEEDTPGLLSTKVPVVSLQTDYGLPLLDLVSFMEDTKWAYKVFFRGREFIANKDMRGHYSFTFRVPLEWSFVGTLPLGRLSLKGFDEDRVYKSPRVLANLLHADSTTRKAMDDLFAAVIGPLRKLYAERVVLKRPAEFVSWVTCQAEEDGTPKYLQVRNVRVRQDCTVKFDDHQRNCKLLVSLDEVDQKRFSVMGLEHRCFRLFVKCAHAVCVHGQMVPVLTLSHAVALPLYDVAS